MNTRMMPCFCTSPAGCTHNRGTFHGPKVFHSIAGRAPCTPVEDFEREDINDSPVSERERVEDAPHPGDFDSASQMGRLPDDFFDNFNFTRRAW